jgi:hypothetical protein
MMKKREKGKMARGIVYFCITVMTITLIWAMVLKTIALFNGQIMVDVSDVLTFTGAAFGGELLLLAFKRIFAKPNKEGEHYENDYSETDQ